MTTSVFRSMGFASVLAAIACGFGAFGSQRSAWAQDANPKADTATDAESLKKLIDRINKLEAEVERLKNGAPAVGAAAEPQVLAMLDIATMALFYSGNSQTRYLVLHVMLANTTKQNFTISRDQIVAEIDGDERKLKDLPAQLLNYSIQSGKQSFQISTMKPPKEWKLPAGGQAAIWLVYPELPLAPHAPKCRLKIKLGETTKEINVNEVQRAQLGLEVQRIGPRQSLALVTINGTMNTFNTSSLVDELDRLVEQKVARVVLRWGDGALAPDQQIMNWLQMAAVNNGGNPNNNQLFPVVPSALREFHLTEFPASEETQGRNSFPYGLRPTTQPRIHKTSAESVGAALRTAYLALPKDELLDEIRNGHPLSRAAALAYGGGRLDIDQLPQIFGWVEDKDPEIQKAALQALSHFGEPQAIEKLVLYAQRNIEPLSSSAIESLAGSRFGAAHDALLKLLNNEPAASKKKIIQILAKYPRPIWSETLFDFVTNNSTGMDADSVKALVQVGHADLVDVLERCLKSTDKPLRELAFQELAKRNDERSETLAVDHALKLLESGPPDVTVVQLLSRTKEPRAIPLLLKQLDTSNDRLNTINLLMQLGDQTIADKLVSKYLSMNPNEKVQVLQGLKIFRHAKFRELCGEALTTNDNQLVTTASNALVQDAHPDGEKLLIAALDKQKTVHLLGNIMNALANFGTPTARAALIKARDAGDSSRKLYATNALALMRQRSPGYQYVYQGVDFRRKNQDKEAMEAFEMALQLDPTLPEAYLQRGTLLLKQEKFAAARKDFETVIELKHDPLDGEFVTSLAIARIGDGMLDEGLKYLEENRAKQLEGGGRDPQKKTAKNLFLYNSACAYSRATEQVDRNKELPDRETLREKYRKQAIDDLTESVKQGFDDFKWMEKDPDFKILREDSEFKKILAGKPADKAEDKPSSEEN